MKVKNLWIIAVHSILFLISCGKMEMDYSQGGCQNSDTVFSGHPKGIRLTQIIDKIVDLGVPGVTMALRDHDGTWAYASGLAKIESGTRLEICHLQFGQSVAKTYMSTAILLLWEQGLISLDEKINKYLPRSVIEDIENSDQATVRMLLNHTSGIAEYNDKPKYVTFLLQHPLHNFSTDDYLDFVRGKPAKFNPGEKYSYTNTNYILLALIADEITEDHKAFIRDEILKDQGLFNSYYHDPGFMEFPELVNTYWDRYSNGKIENCSEMHRTNVGSLIGDDGIIATPTDFVFFLEKLLKNQILSDSSMDEMLEFVQQKPDSPDGYGLGIHQEFYKGFEELGHTGGGIGAGCILAGFTHNETYFFIGMNLGTSITPTSNISEPFEDYIDEIYDILIE